MNFCFILNRSFFLIFFLIFQSPEFNELAESVEGEIKIFATQFNSLYFFFTSKSFSLLCAYVSIHFMLPRSLFLFFFFFIIPFSFGRRFFNRLDCANVVFVPALSGLFAPHWDASARGLLIGLSQHTQRGHICRALLEAVSFRTKEVLDAAAAAGVAVRALRVDGGMCQSDLLMRVQAAVLGVNVLRPADLELTARGAAYAAAIGVGDAQSVQARHASADASSTTTFAPDDSVRVTKFATWQRAVKRACQWETKD